jgi:leucyl-tRNA synthetase
MATKRSMSSAAAAASAAHRKKFYVLPMFPYPSGKARGFCGPRYG